MAKNGRYILCGRHYLITYFEIQLEQMRKVLKLKMDPLVEKTLELRKCMYGDDEGKRSKKGKKGHSKVKKEDVVDSIQDSLSNSVRTLAQFFGFHEIDASALFTLTTVVSHKLESISRQMAILERRKADRLPQPYSSPLLHVLSMNGIPSYQSLGVYYERRIRATYEQVKTRAAQLTKKKALAPPKRRAAKRVEYKEEEEDEGEEEYLQYLGVADVVTGDSGECDENGNAPKKRMKRAGNSK